MKAGSSHCLGLGAGRAVLPALAVALALSGASGCVVDVDLGGARLVCSDGRCPGGFTCLEDRCVPEGEAPGPADAAPPPDAPPPPDAAPPPDAPPPPSCDQLYGGAPGFVLCNEDQVSCQFFVDTGAAAVSCADLCLDGGGTCITGNNASNMAGLECEEQEETDCELVLNSSQICTCTRGLDP